MESIKTLDELTLADLWAAVRPSEEELWSHSGLRMRELLKHLMEGSARGGDERAARPRPLSLDPVAFERNQRRQQEVDRLVRATFLEGVSTGQVGGGAGAADRGVGIPAPVDHVLLDP